MSLLEAEQINVTFYPNQPDRQFQAVRDASFCLQEGEILGMVGESGCGKSLTALSLLNLTPRGALADGKVLFRNQSYQAGSDRLNDLRGTDVGMIFQEPMTALNPVFSVGDQLDEALYFNRGIRDSAARRQKSVELLNQVHLGSPESRLDQYPHELSGGQRQRVMIALSLVGEPDCLIADEPTTALDATVENSIMNLFEELASTRGLGVLLITHDLPLVGRVSDRICVMYSGHTVETGNSDQIMNQPQHPYTRGLVASSRAIEEPGVNRLPVVPGEVPSPEDRPSGCPFHPRCDEAEDRCRREFPEEYTPVNQNVVACWARESSTADELKVNGKSS